MRFEIEPLKGAGNIKIGMKRSDLIDQFEEVPDSVFKGQESAHKDDYFLNIGFSVSYDAFGLIEAIEFTNEAEVFLEGTNLFNLPFEELKAFLIEKDKDLVIETGEYKSQIYSLTSKKLGVSVWTPDSDENAPPESVLIFGPDYY